jgi:RNA polymerase sigma factor (sigma-70 family)
MDWLEEMQAEGAIAAVRAGMDYDPTSRVPFRVFAAKRVMGQAITRYRKEWTYARLRSDSYLDRALDPCDNEARRFSEEVELALSNLKPDDRRLLERLFWNQETEADVARSLGVSQQAVSKRKLSILRTLQRIIGGVKDGESAR